MFHITWLITKYDMVIMSKHNQQPAALTTVAVAVLVQWGTITTIRFFSGIM